MYLGLCFLFLGLNLNRAGPPRAVPDPTLLGIPFQRYTTRDSYDRTITFYLSIPPKTEKPEGLPIVLFIGGSGCQSLFSKRGDRIASGYQNILLTQEKGRARVLVVEKPGIKFLDAPERPGSAIGASEEFLKEHTLQRWAEANVAALRAAWTLRGIDRSRTLVIGHSEGGIVAARVAAEAPEVTHIASLAGGGPTQLFDLAEFQAQPRVDDKPGDAERRVAFVYTEWAKVLNNPQSIKEFWLGHPYRRWSSFLQRSVTEELLRSKAKVFLAQGAEDKSVSIRSFEVLLAELKGRGRDVTSERLAGADHGFRTSDMPQGSPDGMKGMFDRVLNWFFSS
jgi:pimeloyl-ACP methyl ester carboxylesterase